jgi:hypothetical protein
MTVEIPAGYPRVVLSPEIPEADRRLMAGQSGDLVPAGRPRPSRDKGEGRFDTFREYVLAGGFLSGLGLLLTLFILHFATSDEAGAPSSAVVLGYLALAGTTTLVVASVKAARKSVESPLQRAARVHHAKYLCPVDFDPEAMLLLARAQVAVERVVGSEVNRHGLLGDFENSAVLAQYQWEIGQALHGQTLIRARGEEPHREVLRLSVARVTERVERLETYAERVAEADAAYRAQTHLDENDRYLDLLARTNDETGLASLTEHASLLQTALARTVQDAIAAGRTLAL